MMCMSSPDSSSVSVLTCTDLASANIALYTLTQCSYKAGGACSSVGGLDVVINDLLPDSGYDRFEFHCIAHYFTERVNITERRSVLLHLVSCHRHTLQVHVEDVY